jgi:hypothetical protein
MGANPATPIDFVKEPVHDDQQDYHGQKPGRGLEVEGGNIIAEGSDNSCRDDPSDQGRDEGDASPDCDWSSVGTFRADHAGGDCGQDKDALEAFPKDEDPDIEKRDRAVGVWTHWIRLALFGHALPNQDRDDCGRGQT